MKQPTKLSEISRMGKILFVLLFCLSGIMAVKANAPMYIRSGTTNDPTTMKTITWMSQQINPVQAHIRIAKQSDGESSFVTKTDVGRTMNFDFDTWYIGNIANPNPIIPRRANSVAVSGLEPGTTYIYQVGDGVTWSSTREFTTVQAGITDFTFFVLGDLQATHAGNTRGGTGWLRTIAQRYDNSATRPLFTVQVGDLVDREHVYRYYSAFGAVCDAFPAFANTDMVFAKGNHEYFRGINTANLTEVTDPPRGDLSKFLSGIPPTSHSPVVGSGTFYVDYGNLRVITLDFIGKGTSGASHNEVIDAQAAWLREVLENCPNRWRIASMHYPIYEGPNSQGQYFVNPFTRARTVFAPIFEEFNVQLVFAGHSHVDRRIQVRNGVTLHHGHNSNVTPNAPIYISAGNLADFTSSTIYYRVDVNNDRMIVSNVRNDNGGNVGYSFTIRNWVRSVSVSGAGGANQITTEGGTLQMEAIALPDFASNRSVTWSLTTVPAANVAVISADGLLTARRNGTVTVTATANDGSGEFAQTTVTITGQPEQETHFPAGGNGTATDPFQITNADELAALASLVNAGTAGYNPAHYILMNDIDLNVFPYNQGAGWTTIGEGNRPFTGVFDGNGKTISGLFINQTGANKGLFGVVGGNAIIRNVRVVGSITNTSTTAGWNECVGGIAGQLHTNASLQNSSFSGTVTGVRTSIGGLVGLLNNSATITNSWSDATVRNTTNGNNGRLGGLVGAMEANAVVSNSFFSGLVIAAGERTGGIAGHMNGAGTRISNCFVSGEVRGNQWSTGGIVGFMQSAGIVENNYVVGLVSENSSIRLGGILGRANNNSLAITLRNNIVLSPSIRGNGGNQARIHGDPVTVNAPFTYSNNFAWDGVLNFAGNTNWGATAANNRNGANVTKEQINEAGFFEALFAGAASGVWTFAQGKLPGLRGEAIEMPEHLRLLTLPNITAQPQSATYNHNATANALTVTATSLNDGTLTYQWFSNAVNSNTSGTKIDDAIEASFIPPTTEVGTIFYYVEITNTYDGGSSTIASNVATITIIAIVDAQAPSIIEQPQSAIYEQTNEAAALFVTAVSLDDGTLSYQWFSNATNSNAGGTKIVGAIEASFIPPTNAVETIYYYVEITNTNSAVNGATTATIASNVASIQVSTRVGITNPQIGSLRAWINSGILHISGLVEGQTWKLYNTSGLLVKQGVADSNLVTVVLNLSGGVYIIQSEGHTLKVVFI